MSIIAIALVTASLLMVLGGPRFISEISKFVSRQPMGLVFDGEFPTDAGFDRIVRSHGRALDWLDDPRTSRELAQTYLARSFVALGEGADPLIPASQAVRYFTDALRETPADHYLWYVLAQAELVRGDIDAAVRALVRSYRAVPLDHDNTAARLSVSLQLLDSLDIVAVEQVAAEVIMLAETSIPQLTLTAVTVGRAEEVFSILEISEVDEEIIVAYVASVRRLIKATRS